MRGSRRHAASAALALLLGAPPPTRAQEPLTFSAEVGLVQVEVRVTDDGRPVSGLRPEDFVLEENGEAQEIAAFEFVGPGAAREALDATAQSLPRPGARPAAPARSERTWLYVIPEVQHPQELRRVADALRDFLGGPLPDGFSVSLSGLPFTDDRELLLAALDRMVERPVESTDPVLDLEEELIFEREMAAALQRQNGIRTSFVGLSYDPPNSGGRADDVSSLVSVERLDRQILFFGRLALLRYLDLIERMATLPGKKIVLLYRSGLRVDAEHTRLLEEIAAAAVRHRVSFYTSDARGLLAGGEAADERRPQSAWQTGRRSRQPDLIGRQLAEVEPQQGLVSLASTTGGRSVVNSTDMASILQRAVADSRDYYLLGYRPRDTRQDGRFRKVKVSVKRRGVDVRGPRGYFEPKAYGDQSDEERSLALYRTLADGAPGEVEVQGRLDFFAGADGRTATLVSTGVRPEAFARSAGEALEATILVRVRDEVFDRAPVYFEQSLRSAVGEDLPAAPGDAASPLVAYNARVDLPPGHYSLRVLYRDDRSGRTGVLDRSFRVPDLTGASVPSSLLLTRLARPVGADEAQDLLSAGALRFAPEPGRVFRQGDLVYWTYHLYDPTPEDRAAAAAGLQMGLLRDGEWLPPGSVEAGGQGHPGDGVIRFGAWIDTRTLAPGRYTVLAILPDFRRREVPELRAAFDLLPGAVAAEDTAEN